MRSRAPRRAWPRGSCACSLVPLRAVVGVEVADRAASSASSRPGRSCRLVDVLDRRRARRPRSRRPCACRSAGPRSRPSRPCIVCGMSRRGTGVRRIVGLDEAEAGAVGGVDDRARALVDRLELVDRRAPRSATLTTQPTTPSTPMANVARRRRARGRRCGPARALGGYGCGAAGVHGGTWRRGASAACAARSTPHSRRPPIPLRRSARRPPSVARAACDHRRDGRPATTSPRGAVGAARPPGRARGVARRAWRGVAGDVGSRRSSGAAAGRGLRPGAWLPPDGFDPLGSPAASSSRPRPAGTRSGTCEIARDGYDQTPTAAFFPLYPLLAPGPRRARSLVAVAVSTVCFFAALVALHALTRIELGVEAARWTVLALAFSPMAFFFSALYSESLFLALSVGAVLAARCDRWAWAGVLGALAAATRTTGVLVLVALALLGWRPAAGRGRRSSRGWPSSRLGLGRFRCGLALAGHDWQAPFDAQQVWFRHWGGPLGGGRTARSPRGRRAPARCVGLRRALSTSRSPAATRSPSRASTSRSSLCAAGRRRARGRRAPPAARLRRLRARLARACRCRIPSRRSRSCRCRASCSCFPAVDVARVAAGPPSPGRAGAGGQRGHARGVHRAVRDLALRGVTVLLDALGTLVALRAAGPAVAELLAERHGVEVTEEQARAGMRAEIAYYRREHHRAGDRAGLGRLRRDCARVLADALPAPAREIGVDALAATLVVAIRFDAYPEVAGRARRAARAGACARGRLELGRLAARRARPRRGWRRGSTPWSPRPSWAWPSPIPRPFAVALEALGVRRPGRCTSATPWPRTLPARGRRGCGRCSSRATGRRRIPCRPASRSSRTCAGSSTSRGSRPWRADGALRRRRDRIGRGRCNPALGTIPVGPRRERAPRGASGRPVACEGHQHWLRDRTTPGIHGPSLSHPRSYRDRPLS